MVRCCAPEALVLVDVHTTQPMSRSRKELHNISDARAGAASFVFRETKKACETGNPTVYS
jgi:hypothetical protein